MAVISKTLTRHFGLSGYPASSSSRLWEFGPIKELLRDRRFEMCQYGMGYKKSTLVLTTEKTFGELGKRCNHKDGHEHLKGTVRVKEDGRWKYRNKTSLAGASPPYCDLWAQVAFKACPVGGRGGERKE